MVRPYQVITEQTCKEIIGFVHGIENVLDCTTVYSTLLYEVSSISRVKVNGNLSYEFLLHVV